MVVMYVVIVDIYPDHATVPTAVTLSDLFEHGMMGHPLETASSYECQLLVYRL